MRARWEHYAHEAEAALATTAAVAALEAVRPLECVRLACEAPDDEMLFADFLNALVYEMATRKMLFSRFSVCLDGTRLSAQAWGEPVDPSRHHPAVEVKGATYTTLRVAREGARWIAQTVVDV
jgi:tRNA nucleotidyltransferase (CCA-adding enzyme)